MADNPKLPPGQVVSRLVFPVLSATTTPDVDTKTYKLRIYGEVETPKILTWDELVSMPHTKKVLDVHCVTRWSRLGDEWEGILLKDLLSLVKPKGEYLMFYSSYCGYSANVPLANVDDNSMLATGWNGKPLEPKHGGPIRGLIPSLYFWKSVKWVDAIEVMKADRPGYWEERGYNMHGDYWKEERYAEGVSFVDKLFFRKMKDKSGG